ncbi:MAG: YIP1 family protein [Halioglobus sp.]|nr:YIP1 family protein [Halioglobus sp.]
MSDSNNEHPAGTQPPSPSSAGFDLGVVISQAKQVITDPAGFYRGMPTSGGYSEPLIFALVMAAVSGAVFGLLSILGLTGAGAAGLFAIIAAPLFMLIGSFILAAVLFVIWKLMGSPHGFEVAYRSVAYSYAVAPVLAVFSVIPYLGTLLRVAWTTWLMIVASVEVHGRARNTAQLVFGILAALVLLSQLSSEYAQRNLQASLERKLEATAPHIEESLQSLQKLGVDENGEIDPEKAGRAIGDFLRGIQEASEGKPAEPSAEPDEQ